MPFPEFPPGFGPHSLQLLDVALTRAWLERVAIGASLSGADNTVCADLWAKVERLSQLQSGQGITRTGQLEKAMAAHRFKIGERVIFHSPRTATAPSVFTVLRLMPAEGQDLTYRIKSTEVGIERIAKERELSSLHEEQT